MLNLRYFRIEYILQVYICYHTRCALHYHYSPYLVYYNIEFLVYYNIFIITQDYPR